MICQQTIFFANNKRRRKEPKGKRENKRHKRLRAASEGGCDWGVGTDRLKRWEKRAIRTVDDVRKFRLSVSKKNDGERSGRELMSSFVILLSAFCVLFLACPPKCRELPVHSSQCLIWHAFLLFFCLPLPLQCRCLRCSVGGTNEEEAEAYV
jgi:hypothetical protein